MFWIGARWRDDVPSRPATRRDFRWTRGTAASPGEFLLVALMVAVAAMVWPLGSRLIERSDASSIPALSVPASMGAWRAADGGLTSCRPAVPESVGPAARHAARRATRKVGLYVGYYRNQSSEHEARELGQRPHEDHASATGRKSARGSRTLDVDGHPVDARTAELAGPGDERLVVWHWYWIDGRLTASDVWAKAYTALGRLTGPRRRCGGRSSSTRRKERPGEAEAALAERSFATQAPPSKPCWPRRGRAR